MYFIFLLEVYIVVALLKSFLLCKIYLEHYAAEIELKHGTGMYQSARLAYILLYISILYEKYNCQQTMKCIIIMGLINMLTEEPNGYSSF